MKFFQPPDAFMKPVVQPELESAAAMRLMFTVSDRLGADVHLTCLSTIPGFLNHKSDYLDYADYRTSSIIGKNSENIYTIKTRFHKIHRKRTNARASIFHKNLTLREFFTL